MKLTEETFKAGMAVLGVVFDRDINDGDLNNAYWLALCGYEDEAVKRGFNTVVRTCKWFPKPAELIAAIAGAGKDLAAIAWAEVKNTLNHWGGMRNRCWLTDGATASAVKVLGGWPWLAQQPIYKLDVMGPTFLAAYERAVERGLNRLVREVAGFRDRDYKTGEFLPIEPIPVGESNAKLIEPENGAEKTQPFLAVWPSKTEKQFADLAAAKKLNQG